MFLYLICLLLLALDSRGCPVIFSQPHNTRASASDYILPTNVKPLRYNITLKPNLDLETIEGSVQIELLALENTRNITIEKRSVTIDDSSVVVEGPSGVIAVDEPTWYDDIEHYVINLQEELHANEKYNLTIGSYSGFLHTDNGGFYLAKYIDEEGFERLVVNKIVNCVYYLLINKIVASSCI